MYRAGDPSLFALPHTAPGPATRLLADDRARTFELPPVDDQIALQDLAEVNSVDTSLRAMTRPAVCR